MAKVKKDPSSTPDERRTKQIDLIRTGVWYSFIAKQGQFMSPYAMAEAIDGDINKQNKWAGYKKRESVPNEWTLELAEKIVPGSAEVFLYGPEQLPLWKAIASSDESEINLIAAVSNHVDGTIARLKQAIRRGQIKVMIRGNATNENDQFLQAVAGIQNQLNQLMPADIAQRIVDEFLINLADELYRKEEEEFLDSIMDSDRDGGYRRKVLDEYQYLGFALPTLGKKGRGGGPKDG